MTINEKLRGLLIEIGETKNGKKFAVVYANGQTIRIYKPSEGLKAQIGKEVVIDVKGFTKEVYLEQVQ